MRDYLKFYINGAWVDPVTPKTLDVINPATEGVAGRISMGSAADVDAAVRAANPAKAILTCHDEYLLASMVQGVEIGSGGRYGGASQCQRGQQYPRPAREQSHDSNLEVSIPGGTPRMTQG